jgi:hypothetical protein
MFDYNYGPEKQNGVNRIVLAFIEVIDIFFFLRPVCDSLLFNS